MSILNATEKASAISAEAAAFENADETLGNAAETVVVEEVAVETKPEGKPARRKPVDVEQKPEAKPEPEAPAAAETKPATSVVAAAAKPLGHVLSAGGNVSPLRDLKGAFEAQGIDVSYSTFPRYRDDKGVIGDTDGNEAGGWVEVMVVSWSDSWIVTPGDDSDKAKDYVRYSRDGHTINSEDEWNGKTCEEYVEYLRDQVGYEKAASKKYTNVYGMLVAAENDDCPGLQQVIHLAMPPTSGSAWEAYLVNRALRSRMGMVKETTGNPVVRFTTHRVKNAKNTFYKLVPTEGVTEVAI